MTPFRRIAIVGFSFWLSYDLARFPVLPLYAQHLGVSAPLIGWIVAASTITGIFGKFVSGGLSDIVGRRVMMLLASTIAVTAPLFYYFATDPASLIMLRLFHGFGTAIMGPVTRAAVSDIAPANQRGQQLSTFSAISMSGTMTGRWLGGAILFWGGFLMPFFAACVAGLAVLVLLLRWPHDSPKKDVELHMVDRWIAGFREVISHRVILVTSVVEAIQFMATGAIDAFLPIYAKTVAGLNEWQVGSLFGVTAIATLVTKPLFGTLSDRIGRRPQIIGGFLVGAAVVWVFPHFSSFWVLAGLATVYGFGVAVTTSATAAYITDVCAREHYGAAHGVFGTIFDIGHAAGPITAGLLVGAFSFVPAFAVFSCLLVLAAVVFTFWSR